MRTLHTHLHVHRKKEACESHESWVPHTGAVSTAVRTAMGSAIPSTTPDGRRAHTAQAGGGSHLPPPRRLVRRSVARSRRWHGGMQGVDQPGKPIKGHQRPSTKPNQQLRKLHPSSFVFRHTQPNTTSKVRFRQSLPFPPQLLPPRTACPTAPRSTRKRTAAAHRQQQQQGAHCWQHEYRYLYT